MLNQIKGVIFDLDGLLVDSEELHYLAWVRVLKTIGINFSKEEFSGFVGNQLENIVKEVIKKHKVDVDPKKLVLQRRKTAIEIFKNAKVKTMPYAKEALDFFVKCNKIKIGLASGGIRKIVLLKLKSVGLYKFFSAIVAGDDVKNWKPHPASYLLATKKLKLKPEECLAFEDSQYGVESAKSAGLFCFAIPNKYSRTQNFSKADKVFKNLKEVIDYIKTKNPC